jgi:hypothetical protein
MPRYMALRAFPLSRNGIQIEEVEAGSPVEVPEHLAPCLLREGYIAPAAELPEPWEAEPSRSVAVEEPQEAAPAPAPAPPRQTDRKRS